MSGNFVQISRKVLKDEIIMTDGDYFAVYMFLMLNVTHTEQPKKFKGEWITLKPGQGIFGREDIAKKLKINESKIQRILTKFKNEQLIEQQTSNQNRLVTMLFWDSKGDSEQLNEQRMNNECTTDEQRMNTNNKENKEKKEKKEDNKELTVVAKAKPKQKNKIKSEKISYSENVFLTTDQYTKLVSDYGEDVVKKNIFKMTNYQVYENHFYKDHYRALSNWCYDNKDKKDFYKEKSNNLSDLRKKMLGNEVIDVTPDILRIEVGENYE